MGLGDNETAAAISPDQSERDIYVTRPYLPPLEEFIPYLEEIWNTRILTNAGPFHEELERALCEYLGVKHISLFNNGTIALVTALQSLNITGEVITTPYTFVATTHSLIWNRIKPIFVDVEPSNLNIDPAKIEEAITPQTTAVLAVHCYGHPCNVEKIAEITERYNLRLIYDAAHAFGVNDRGGSILRHGDLSVLSFHATKVFNTFEGGAIVSPDAQTKQQIDLLKNFGFSGEANVIAPGINGKMSEFAAALGLLQLQHIDDVIAKRGAIDAAYRARLDDVKGIRCLIAPGATRQNFAYFPILVGNQAKRSRDELIERFKEKRIFARRYFYPAIPEFPMYRGLSSSRPENLPIAYAAANEIICLPIFPEMPEEVVDRVCDIIAD